MHCKTPEFDNPLSTLAASQRSLGHTSMHITHTPDLNHMHVYEKRCHIDNRLYIANQKSSLRNLQQSMQVELGGRGHNRIN